MDLVGASRARAQSAVYARCTPGRRAGSALSTVPRPRKEYGPIMTRQAGTAKKRTALNEQSNVLYDCFFC